MRRRLWIWFPLACFMINGRINELSPKTVINLHTHALFHPWPVCNTGPVKVCVHPTTLESMSSEALIEPLGRHRGDEECGIWTRWTWEGFAWEELTSCVSGKRSGLLGHFDAEGNAAQELVALVAVEKVRTLHLALDDELGVIVVLHQQQLHGYHRLDVVCLMERRQKYKKLCESKVWTQQYKNCLTHVMLMISINQIFFYKCLILKNKPWFYLFLLKGTIRPIQINYKNEFSMQRISKYFTL